MVLYCGVCSLPVEYCSYSVVPEQCKTWLHENDPDVYDEMYGEEDLAEDLENSSLDGSKSKGTRRAGKGLMSSEAKKAQRMVEARQTAKVILKLVDRNKRKSVTHIIGMEVFGLDLKAVAKRCASKYACGCSVTANAAGVDEIVIQGDVVDDLMDFIPAEWPEISSDQIEYQPKQKSKK